MALSRFGSIQKTNNPIFRLENILAESNPTPQAKMISAHLSCAQ
jgi:hypothetical protein